MSTNHKTLKRASGDASWYFEAFIWITFAAIGPLIWMHRLFEASRYQMLAIVCIGWMISMGVYLHYLFTKRSGVPSVAVVVLWCIALLIVFWRS